MPDPDGRPRILILGGTGEARQLAETLVDGAPGLPPLDVVSSLAGRTRVALALPGRVRVGGFGGAEGLVAYLRGEAIDLLVDVTHPFSPHISANAAAASAAAGVPRLVLWRSAWRAQPGDRWIEAVDAADAAALVPQYGRRAFVAVGSNELAAFAGLPDTWCLVRLVDPPAAPLPLANHRVVTGRGPFDLAAERALLAAHDIDVVVCKASGGAAGAAKLEASRECGLPVVMIRRPPPPPGPCVGSVAEIVAAMPALLDALTARHDTPAP
jgi:precorrin-6A/cobalt-precorrin-6A reductase